MILWHIHSPPFARTIHKYRESNVRGGHTSQLSRTEQRDLATDLSGPKALVESLTPRSSSAAADVVDLEFEFSSSAAALGLKVPSGRIASCPRSGRAEISKLSERTIRDSDESNHVHVLSEDGGGQTPSSSPPRPLPTATLTSGCGCE